jgi:SanA protein
MQKITRKILFITLASILIIIVGIMVFCNVCINRYSEKYVFENPGQITENKTGLLLGTSKYLSRGKLNMYFMNRIEAAVELYKAGKIHYIIVSGDNRHLTYNEPMIMKKELIRQGIPADSIYVDYAGFRTLDSVVRGKEIFGQASFTIISQEFHNKRAVFIARKKGINAIGYNAKDVTSYMGFKTKVREIFARVKAVLDIYILNADPHFLGEKIVIG